MGPDIRSGLHAGVPCPVLRDCGRGTGSSGIRRASRGRCVVRVSGKRSYLRHSSTGLPPERANWLVRSTGKECRACHVPRYYPQGDFFGWEYRKNWLLQWVMASLARLLSCAWASHVAVSIWALGRRPLSPQVRALAVGALGCRSQRYSGRKDLGGRVICAGPFSG